MLLKAIRSNRYLPKTILVAHVHKSQGKSRLLGILTVVNKMSSTSDKPAING
ncbi:hypothetical protein [Flavivirga aquatica]|uniref:hypothetical protein n=1 Tax=Flavivirga aquatica TaxID=1849968 RepID=UPI0013F4BF7C|nr:hypothetical protein [Flavivirga aquatica]